MIRLKERTLRQLLNLMPIVCLEITTGIGVGWTGVMIYRLKTFGFVLSIEETALLGSLTALGRFFGPAIFALIFDKIGHRRTLILCSFSYCITWFALYCFKTVNTFLQTRFVFGVTLGIMQSGIPIYITENSSPTIRGNLIGYVKFFYSAGILIMTVAGLFLDYNIVHLSFFVFSVFTTISTYFIKESPQFLIQNDKIKEASIIFHWLRPPVSEVTETYFMRMKENVEEEKSKFLPRVLLGCPYIVKCLRMVIIFNLLLFSTGSRSASAYISIMFDGVPEEIINIMMIIDIAAQTGGACLAFFFIDSFDRKTLLYFGSITLITVNLLIAFLYNLNTVLPNVQLFYLIFILFLIFVTVFVAILYPLSYCILGEILPQSAKPFGCALGISSASLSIFILSYLFLPLTEKYGMWMNFFLYSVMGVILLIYIHYKIPETRGKTLLDIQKTLKYQDADESNKTLLIIQH